MDIHVVVAVVWKPGIATSTQVSDDFAKQARAMAETRLDARKQIQSIWVYAG